MNIIKKTLSLLLVFVLFATMMPVAAFAAESEEIPCEHVYTSYTVEAGCESEGFTHYSCTVCEDSYDTNFVSPLGHNYIAEVVNGYTVYTCSICNDTYSEKLPSFSYDKATKLTNGKSYILTVCYNGTFYALSHNGDDVSSRIITVANGKVTSPVADDLLWNYSRNKLTYEDYGNTYSLYAGSSVSWAGSGTGNATLTGSLTRSSNVTFSGSRLKVGSYYLRFTEGTIKGNVNSGITYIFQANAQ